MSAPHARKPAATPARPASPGRPKDLAKGAAILDAAKRMFTEHGFDRTSMDQIASGAGVSKLTVYSHFGAKEPLFAAAVKSHCDTRLPDALFELSPDTPLPAQIGRASCRERWVQYVKISVVAGSLKTNKSKYHVNIL